MTSFGAALAEGRRSLQTAGVASAALDARLLMAAAAGLKQAALIAGSGETVPSLAEGCFRSYLNKRLAGEPVARILGEKEFWGLSLRVGPATLVPRPETETLVEVVLSEMKRPSLERVAICDLGTGSGAILIALLTELPEATGVGVDICPATLDTAWVNAERHGVLSRISFHAGDYAVAPRGAFDVVVSNPPYIRSGDILGLSSEVRDHDPRAALDGGPDGLAAYRTILGRVSGLLATDGLLAFEVGHDQSDQVAALCRAHGLGEIAAHSDLAGKARVVTSRRGLSQTIGTR